MGTSLQLDGGGDWNSGLLISSFHGEVTCTCTCTLTSNSFGHISNGARASKVVLLSPARPPSSYDVLFMGPVLPIKHPCQQLAVACALISLLGLPLAARSHGAVHAAA